MDAEGTYRTVVGSSEAEIVEKKSRFIAHLAHVDSEEEALDFLQRIRTEHAQARHNVYAYILRGGRARYSDDGEPSQTAGIPTYESLLHADLTDAICVTTRYFGGTLLGTGGLVRAYTQACQAAIEGADVVTIARCIDMSLTIPYELYGSLAKVADGEETVLLTSEFAENVHLVFRTRESRSDALHALLTDLTRGRCTIHLGEPIDSPM